MVNTKSQIFQWVENSWSVDCLALNGSSASHSSIQCSEVIIELSRKVVESEDREECYKMSSRHGLESTGIHSSCGCLHRIKPVNTPGRIREAFKNTGWGASFWKRKTGFSSRVRPVDWMCSIGKLPICTHLGNTHFGLSWKKRMCVCGYMYAYAYMYMYIVRN